MRLKIICSVFLLSFFFVGCLEDYCDPNEDEGYCDGNVAMKCGSNPEGMGHIWSRGECDKDPGQPYCIVGRTMVNGKTQNYASCSSIPTVKEECFSEDRIKLQFCINGKVATCSDIGGAILIRDKDC